MITRPELAPTWAVPYGEEMWRRRPVESGAGIDLHDVIDRVTHAIQERDGSPQVRARRYTATFDGIGVRLTPRGETGEARVHTTRIALGDRDVYRGTASGTWSVLGNTAQTLRAPGIVEHHEAERDGIELTWVLRERGAGDLTIEIALEGDARVGVGQAELVDARGQRWPIETETTSSGARWRVGAEILDRAAFPVALDPLIGPEHAADDIVLSNSRDWQRFASVTSNANGYFVVWDDDDNNRIGATRVTPTGMLLDPAGITIGPSVGDAPRVASNGTDFLVVFAQLFDIRAIRVSSSGLVLDSSSIELCGSVNRCGSPDVASNGSGYLVAWQDSWSTNDIYAARVTSAGVVQDPGGFVVTDTVADQRTPAVASNGSDYMVVWPEGHDTTSYDTYGSRVTAAGNVLDPGGFPISMSAGDQNAPRIASNGSSYLVVWEDGRPGSNYDIYGARLTTTGAVSDPNGILIGTGPNNQMHPTVASNGTDFLVTWETQLDLHYDVFASRVTGAGAVVDPAGIAVATGPTIQRLPAVASYDSDYLVAWQAFSDIRATLISGTGVPVVSGPGTPLALSSNEFEPSIASNGTGYLVAWQDSRGGDSTGVDMYAARLSASGATLDPAGLALSTTSGGQIHPAVASNGTDYLVAWQDTRSGNDDIYATRVSATGVISDPSGLAVSTTPARQMNPAVASNGTDYVVAWQDSRNSTGYETEYDIYAARIPSAGANLDPMGIAVSTVSGQQRAPTVASNGIGYLLAWEDRRAGSNVYATRMTTSGAILDGSGFVAGTSHYVYQAALASNGTDYLVAWEDFDGHVYATRISAAGDALAPMNMQLGNPMSTQREPAVASNGVEYVVWWQTGSGRYSDIYACRVTAAGDVVDGSGVPIAAGGAGELTPTAAYNASTATYGVAYEADNRIFARLVSFCGDFSIEASETCDDGNSASGDGCSSTCQPEPGFECAGTPSVCTDIDECAMNNGGCTQVCTNTSPGFTCTCAAGYRGDGITCTDLDECATNNGDCAGTCTNSDGSYACSCATGFELGSDGHACNDIDECAADNGGCSPDATCTNTAPGFSCACATGYTGDGVTCTDIDECTTNNGGCAQVCMNSPGTFACSCNSGYMLADDGVTCIAIDACVADPDSCKSDDGCGCHSSTPSTSALWLVMLGLGLRRRRKQ